MSTMMPAAEDGLHDHPAGPLGRDPADAGGVPPERCRHQGEKMLANASARVGGPEVAVLYPAALISLS
jgi:hypothetical protein